MLTRPKAFSAFAEWNFHLKQGNVQAFQSGASLFSPVEHVVPYLRDVERLMDNRDLVPYKELVDLTVTSVPACGNEPCSPVTKTTSRRRQWFGEELDFADVCRLWWGELRSTAQSESENRGWADPTSGNVAYRWHVWYSGGESMELAFTMLDRKGVVEELFRVERSPVGEFVEMLQAPENVTSLFSL